MFTGLIESIGRVLDMTTRPSGARLRLRTSLAAELAPGDSLAANGVCLTVAALSDDAVEADIGPETARVTMLGSLVAESVADPSKYYRSNVQAGLALMDMMRLSKVNRIVVSSTAAVYGEPSKQPIEEHDPVQPSNPYGETKLALERALQWYGRAYGLQSICLRYFNAAGASARNGERHDPETHLIPRVLDVAAGNSAVLQVFGDDYPTKDGTCVRDYIHVQDLAEAHVLALEALAGTGAPSSVYNLGGGGGYSIREVVETAQLVTGRSIPTEIGPRRAGDPPILIASSDRIKKELGWSSTRQRLADIIDSAWQWMQTRNLSDRIASREGHS